MSRTFEDVEANTIFITFCGSIPLSGLNPLSTTLDFSLHTMDTFDQGESFLPSTPPIIIIDRLKELLKIIWGINNAGSSVDAAFTIIDLAIDSRWL